MEERGLTIFRATKCHQTYKIVTWEDGDWDWAGSRKDEWEKTLVLFDGDIAAITKCARPMMH